MEEKFCSYISILISNKDYNSELKEYARQNRKAMTKAEACLWKYALKNRQMLGQRFLRQRPIDKYIVDFCGLELDLVIEVDGESHNHTESYAKDLVRQARLEELGFRVLRFTDDQVLKNMRGVRMSLEMEIRRLIAL